MLHIFSRCASGAPSCLRSAAIGLLATAVLIGAAACRKGEDAGGVVAAADCDGAAELDARGEVIFPAEATETEAPVYVDEDLGLLSDLYPDLDTTTDAFYPNLPCEGSIGGELPVDEPPSQDSVDAEAFLNEFDTTAGADLLADLQANPLSPVGTFADFAPGECFIVTEGGAAGPGGSVQVPCDDPVFLDSSMPFEGRDIIYMHGLDTGDLFARISNPTGPAGALWPQDAAAFLNDGGFFREAAEAYWLDHVTEHLSSQFTAFPSSGWQWTPTDIPDPVYIQKANRYLLVAWSSNQTIEYAQHAMLTQIRNAMQNNDNVVTPLGYPAEQVRPFCSNGCIVIGHSTGPLITNSALGLAAAGFYGQGGRVIARHVAAHVSFDGALSGSRIATIGMAVSMLGAPLGTVGNLLCDIMDAIFGTQNSCDADLSFVATSILRDLIPAVSQLVWGPAVNASPVPTVTFAGGHPTGNQALGLTQLFLPGVDDGVVTMNSACGNPNPVFPYVSPPSGVTVTGLVKAFDFSEFGDRLTRATKIFISQKNMLVGLPYPGPQPGPNYLAAACSPHLSATGMVMPVASGWAWTPLDSRTRYNNHYSFIQSLGEHSYDGGGHAPNEWPSKFGYPATELREYAPVPTMTANLEESRVVTDPSVYSRMLDANGTYLLKALDMHEVVRGRKVSFKMPFNIGGCKRPQGATLYRCQRWLWKRTYHLADKWERKQSSHYAYEFVGRR